jgi:demethylmenaquinone methyltransferase / 2-methoxy-6-polyprenyl-1,4-benzoquinol methylase
MDEPSGSMFGYERVDSTEKTRRVRGVFDAVADRYDLMNDLMSGGLHRLWKRYAVTLLDVRPGQEILDLAGGTADLTRLIAGRNERLRVWCSDINARMLARGRERSIDAGCAGGIHYVQANAEQLPFASASLDRVIIGFGLRNVTHKSRALEEMVRVLVPGGRAVILEFSTVQAPLLARLYDTYSFNILPRLGKMVARDEASYRYLAESIRVHPDQESLALMMERAGFAATRYHNLVGGIVAAHVGWTC